MKKIKMTTVTGHQTEIEVDDGSVETIKRAFFESDPFLVNFKNKTIWINPGNIYFVEMENNVVD